MLKYRWPKVKILYLRKPLFQDKEVKDLAYLDGEINSVCVNL